LAGFNQYVLTTLLFGHFLWDGCESKTKLLLQEQRIEIVKRYFILDTLAICGRAIEPGTKDASRAIFVSG
jgi:hypothetical protein